MSEDMTETELAEFNTKLQQFKETLSDSQKDLLDAILKTAWRLADTQNGVDAEFDNSFTPQAASLLFQYASAPMSSGVSIHSPGMITPIARRIVP